MLLVKYTGYGFIFSLEQRISVSHDKSGYLYSGVLALTDKDENNLKVLGELATRNLQPIEHQDAPELIPTEYRNNGFMFRVNNEYGDNDMIKISTNPLQAVTTCKSNKIEFLNPLNEAISKRVLDKNYITKELLLLIDASEKFWSNADPEDKDTHPKNPEAETWLKKKGFSKNKAEVGASIIRPEWAAKGNY